MKERTIADLLAEHEFFAGLSTEAVTFLAGCGTNVHFDAGSYLFHEGDPADTFFIVRSGRVALEALAPGRGPLLIDTLGAGEIVGVSWLFPPHRWTFDGRAVEPVRAVSLDGVCIREKCERDTQLGYELMQRFAGVFRSRLESARLRLLDLYGTRDVG